MVGDTERATLATLYRVIGELAEIAIIVGDRYLQLSSVDADAKHLVGQLVRRAAELRDQLGYLEVR